MASAKHGYPHVVALFADHPVNQMRSSQGRLPATNIWLWGQGARPTLPRFEDHPELRLRRFLLILGPVFAALAISYVLQGILPGKPIQAPGQTPGATGSTPRWPCCSA